MVVAVLLVGIKKKIVDAVDGGGGSKPAVNKDAKPDVSNDHGGENAFDQVERRPLLSDVRATRAKAPGKWSSIKDSCVLSFRSCFLTLWWYFNCLVTETQVLIAESRAQLVYRI